MESLQATVESNLIEEFIEQPKEMRSAWLNLRPRMQQDAILLAFSHDSRLTVTDAIYLEEVHHVRACQAIVGHRRRGIPASGRTFFVGPVKDGDAIPLSNGSLNNKTRYINIDRPMPIPANKAIQAIYCWGPRAELESQRGRLKELTAMEFGIYASKVDERAAHERAKSGNHNKGHKAKR
jgi:hypothetical protein